MTLSFIVNHCIIPIVGAFILVMVAIADARSIDEKAKFSFNSVRHLVIVNTCGVLLFIVSLFGLVT